MAACFQVILTWSSLTTAKLFPFFFSPPPPPPPPPPLFFRSFRVRSKTGRASANKNDGRKLWRVQIKERASFQIQHRPARWKGGGVKGSRDFIRGGCVFSRLCDVSGGRNQKFRDTPDVEGLTSLLQLRRPVSFNVESLLSGEQVLPGNLPDVWIHCDSQTVPLSKRILSEIVYKNYSRTITILLSFFLLPFISPPLEVLHTKYIHSHIQSHLYLIYQKLLRYQIRIQKKRI